jgi:hypothetical protein
LPNIYNSIFIVSNLEVYWFLIIATILLIINYLILSNFIRINKLLKKENIEDKFYSEKPQEKWLLITFWIFILWLIIFYFSYYTKWYEFEKIPDSYFDDTELYKNVDSEENWHKKLGEFIYWKWWIDKSDDDRKFYTKEKIKQNKKIIEIFKVDTDNFYNNSGSLENIDLSKDRVELIDKLRNTFWEISQTKDFIRAKKRYYITLWWISQLSRETIHNVIYYLNNWNTKKWLKYLIEDYKIWKLFIWWYSSLVEKIRWTRISTYSQKNINYILYNYKLKKENLLYLKENIKNSKNIDWVFKKAIIYDYNNVIWNFENDKYNNCHNNCDSFEEKFMWPIKSSKNKLKLNSLIFFSNNYLKEKIKNAYYVWLKTNYNYSEKHFCNRNFLKTRFEKISYLFLKQNWMLNLENWWCLKFRWYKEYFQEIQKQEKLILEKIDKQLKEIEEKEERQKINPKILEFFKK